MSAHIYPNLRNLAEIAFALRYYNMSEEEDAMIPKPWNYQNIPSPVSVERKRVKGDGGYREHILRIERYEDGSVCGVTESV